MGQANNIFHDMLHANKERQPIVDYKFYGPNLRENKCKTFLNFKSNKCLWFGLTINNCNMALPASHPTVLMNANVEQKNEGGGQNYLQKLLSVANQNDVCTNGPCSSLLSKNQNNKLWRKIWTVTEQRSAAETRGNISINLLLSAITFLFSTRFNLSICVVCLKFSFKLTDLPLPQYIGL